MLASTNWDLGQKAAELAESLKISRKAQIRAEANETMARQAQEEAYLIIQRLREQIDAMSARISQLEALLDTLIDDQMVLEGCPRGCTEETSPPGLDELASRARREQSAATAAYAASGAVLATGVVLMYFGRERTIRRRMRPPLEPGAETSGASGAFMPLVTHDSIGVGAMMRF